MFELLNLDFYFLFVVLIVFLILFVAFFFLFRFLKNRFAVLITGYRPTLYYIQHKILEQRKKNVSKAQKENVPYIFSSKSLLDANITTPPKIFFFKVISLYAFFLLLVLLLTYLLSVPVYFYIIDSILYSIAFIIGYLTLLKIRKVNHMKKIIGELPDVTNTMLSTFTRSKNNTLIDAIASVERNYPKYVLTTYFSEIKTEVGRGASPSEALEEMSNILTMGKIKELLNLIAVHNQTTNPIILSHVFDTYVESVIIAQRLIKKSESDSKHFVQIAVLVSVLSFVGIINSFPHSKDLLSSTQSFQYSNIIKMIGVVIPIALLIIGFLVLIYISYRLQEKILEM